MRRIITVLASLLAAACTALPAGSQPDTRSSPSEDCTPHLTAATTALGLMAAGDTTSFISPAHTHGVAMAEYHACTGRAAAERLRPPDR